MREYCEEKNAFSIPMTIRSLLQDFGAAPYGFLDEDILYLLTRLLKDEVISLIYNNEVQNVTSEDTLAKILKRDYYEKTVIKIRQKISIDLINNLKSVARNSFNVINLRDDEDGMVQDFKSYCLTKMINELKNITINYGYNKVYQYPGKEIVDNAINLFDRLLKVRDVSDFFKEITDKKDEINNITPKLDLLLEFFNGTQKEQFDETRKILIIYDNNKDYSDANNELSEVVDNITAILCASEPYSEIHKLPTLRKELIDLLGAMYDAKSAPIIEMIKNTITYMENETQNANVDNEFVKPYVETCKSVISSLEHSNELKDIYAQQTRVDQLKDRFINALENKKNEKQFEIKSGENVDERVVVKRKLIRTDLLMNRSYEINTKEDIERYVEELKAKLLKEFEANNNLTIR